MCLPTTSEASSNDGNITVLCVITPTPIHTHILIHKSSLHIERYIIKLVICSSKIRHIHIRQYKDLARIEVDLTVTVVTISFLPYERC